MSELDRRTVVKGAAWMVPVIAAAIATPLAAASQPPATLRKLLRITHVDISPGAVANTAYVRTGILADTGEAVQQVVVRITLSRDGVPFETVIPYIAGWGSAPEITHELPNIPKGGDITATVEAFAINAELVRGTDVLSAGEQGWWK